MQRAEIERRLQAVFHQVFGADVPALSETMTADDVKAWDSLSHVDLVLAVERAFAIRLGLREVRRMTNVGDLMTLIQAKAA